MSSLLVSKTWEDSMGVFDCLLTVIALYILLSYALGFIAAIRYFYLKKLEKSGKDVPVLEKEYLKHEIKIFFTCTWVIGLAYN